MTALSALDTIALCVFAGAWFIYYSYVEHTKFGRRSLNSVMHEARLDWMRCFQARENRVLDGQIMSGLQNGTAFFASSAFLAIGGALSAFTFTDAATEVFRLFPFSQGMTRTMFEIKVLGLAVIFAYSFFKFVWSYRLFNYVAIMMGAMPAANHRRKSEVEQAVQRAARMNVAAARHFNRGLRAYFFALAYLGWFAGPIAFIATTLVVALVLWRRQFKSDSYAAATWTSAGDGS